ncbi:hypothetical protein CEXT_695301 [Caerostris extrusa]|uniref:Uncharacterized protein n=1 Tax=Caerostris extrusa TaxID=172846 RepID=A0AAV4RUP6_CAEEX|nr:hypothetical protein CEXT_695301 [Caerostris extrusa]
MDKEEACSGARKLITKYRKLLTWWAFVREVPRLMNSNIDVIFELLTYFDMPFHILMKHVATMKELLQKCIVHCVIIKEHLEELCRNIDRVMNTVVTYNSESGIYFRNQYENAMKDAWIIFVMLCDCKKEFLLFCETQYKIFETLN